MKAHSPSGPLSPPFSIPSSQALTIHIYLLNSLFLNIAINILLCFETSPSSSAGVQPWQIQGIQRGDGFGDQETTAYLNVN